MLFPLPSVTAAWTTYNTTKFLWTHREGLKPLVRNEKPHTYDQATQGAMESTTNSLASESEVDLFETAKAEIPTSPKIPELEGATKEWPMKKITEGEDSDDDVVYVDDRSVSVEVRLYISFPIHHVFDSVQSSHTSRV